MKHNRSKTNYMELVPAAASGLAWTTDRDHRVVVDMENTGFYNRLAQALFHKPKVSHIKLDEMGSFIWKQIDGKRSVLEISESVRNRFGDRAEPLLDRLIRYLEILRANQWIAFRESALLSAAPGEEEIE